MTRITFFQDRSQELRGFEVTDHAGYAEAGEDIVCAAISALTINCLNSLETLTEDRFTAEVSQEPPRIFLRMEEEPGMEAALLLKSYKLGIDSICMDETTSTFVDVKSEEV